MDNSEEIKIKDESEKTKKARVKLRKRLDILERNINEKELEKKVIEIHDRISRHSALRVVLKRKSISLFDNNENTAELSKKVNLVAEKLKEDSLIFMQSINNLNESLKEHLIIPKREESKSLEEDLDLLEN